MGGRSVGQGPLFEDTPRFGAITQRAGREVDRAERLYNTETSK